MSNPRFCFTWCLKARTISTQYFSKPDDLKGLNCEEILLKNIFSHFPRKPWFLTFTSLSLNFSSGTQCF